MPWLDATPTSDYYDGSIYRYNGTSGYAFNYTKFGNETGVHSVSYDAYFAFPTTGLIPKTTISSAFLRFISDGDNAGDTCNVTIYFALAYFNFTGGTWSIASFDAMPLTNGVAWNGVAQWSDGNIYDSPDLAAILQEFVNSAYYAASWGNNQIIAIVKNNSSSDNAIRIAKSNHIASDLTELHFEYSNPTRIAQVFTQVEVTPPKRIEETIGISDTFSVIKEVSETVSETLGLSDTFSAFHYTNYANAIDNPHVGPIRIAKIELSGVTLYLCDRIWGSN